jgi:hypothetical protein
MTEQTPSRPAPTAEHSAASDETIADLQRQLIHWRAQALRGWARELADGGPRGAGARITIEEAQHAAAEAHRVAAEAMAQVEAMRHSTSWRVTAPLRTVTDVLRARRGR